MNVLEQIRNIDEYTSVNELRNSSFLDNIKYPNNPQLKQGFNASDNLLTLWFFLLQMNGTITKEERVDRLFFNDAVYNISYEKLDEIENFCTAILNRICLDCGGIGYRNEFGMMDKEIFNNNPSTIECFYETPIGMIDKIISIFKQYDNSFTYDECFTFTYDEILSSYYSIPNFTDNSIFLRIKYKNKQYSRNMFVFLTPSRISSLYDSYLCPGYNSKLITTLLTGFVRWDFDSFPDKLSDLPQIFLDAAKCFEEDTSKTKSRDIDFESSKGYEKIAEIIDSLIDMSEINAKKIKILSKTSIDRQIAQLELDLQNIVSDINTYTNYLYERRKSKQEKQNLLMGLKYLPQEDSEINAFYKLLKEKCSNIIIGKETITFVHKAFLEEISGVQDLEYFLNILNSGYNQFSDEAYILLKSVFLDKKYKMQVFSEYKFNFYGQQVDCILQEENDDFYSSQDDAIPNPHHRYYDCLGENSVNANDFMIRGDFYGALCTIMYATSGINLADDAVWDKFNSKDIKNLIDGCYKDIKCFYNQELGYLTANQVIEIETKESKGEE